jgi:hypothetical protein
LSINHPPPINPLHEQSPSCESFAAKPLVANHSHHIGKRSFTYLARNIFNPRCTIRGTGETDDLDRLRALHGSSSSPHPGPAGPAGRAILPRKLSPVPGLQWELLWRICHTLIQCSWELIRRPAQSAISSSRYHPTLLHVETNRRPSYWLGKSGAGVAGNHASFGVLDAR